MNELNDPKFRAYLYAQGFASGQKVKPYVIRDLYTRYQQEQNSPSLGGDDTAAAQSMFETLPPVQSAPARTSTTSTMDDPTGGLMPKAVDNPIEAMGRETAAPSEQFADLAIDSPEWRQMLIAEELKAPGSARSLHYRATGADMVRDEIFSDGRKFPQQRWETEEGRIPGIDLVAQAEEQRRRYEETRQGLRDPNMLVAYERAFRQNPLADPIDVLAQIQSPAAKGGMEDPAQLVWERDTLAKSFNEDGVIDPEEARRLSQYDQKIEATRFGETQKRPSIVGQMNQVDRELARVQQYIQRNAVNSPFTTMYGEEVSGRGGFQQYSQKLAEDRARLEADLTVALSGDDPEVLNDPNIINHRNFRTKTGLDTKAIGEAIARAPVGAYIWNGKSLTRKGMAKTKATDEGTMDAEITGDNPFSEQIAKETQSQKTTEQTTRTKSIEQEIAKKREELRRLESSAAQPTKALAPEMSGSGFLGGVVDNRSALRKGTRFEQLRAEIADLESQLIAQAR